VPDRLGPPLEQPLFDRLVIVGLGLIGSSLARAARHLRLARTVVGADASPQVRSRVAELGLVDEVAEKVAEAVRGADYVILCVPVGACGAVAAEMSGALAPGAIVSDVGSVKGAVVANVQPHLTSGVHFVPAHPVAGTEHSGPDAGFATLFHAS
jgi:cyclohexadieny/prephenate dehydrogenase